MGGGTIFFFSIFKTISNFPYFHMSKVKKSRREYIPTDLSSAPVAINLPQGLKAIPQG